MKKYTLSLIFIVSITALLAAVFTGNNAYSSYKELLKTQDEIRESKETIIKSSKLKSIANDYKKSLGEYPTENYPTLKSNTITECNLLLNSIRNTSSKKPVQLIYFDSLETNLNERLHLSTKIRENKTLSIDEELKAIRAELFLCEKTKILVNKIHEEESSIVTLSLDNLYNKTSDLKQYGQLFFFLISICATIYIGMSYKYTSNIKKKQIRDTELEIVNKELIYQNEEKAKRANELLIANQELVKEEAKKEFERNNLSALINNTNDIMWSIDTNYKLISSNKPFINAIKIQTGKTIEKGENFLEIGFPTETTQEYKNYYRRAFSGESFTLTKQNNTQDKNWSEISFHPIYQEGIVIGTACHSRDITSRKKAESRIVEQNKELKKTNAELDRFVYSVSHDLRSPLTSVLGLVNFIEEESKENHTLKYAGMIKKNVNRLDLFIKSILEYSRNNRTESIIEKILIEETVNEIIETLKFIPSASMLRFDVQINSDFDFYSDAQRVKTILENLISNAIKYRKLDAENGFISVTVSGDEQSIFIKISDNGIGIKDEYLAKIFNMFFRVSSTVVGSGIGLYIVKEIVEKLEGTIEIESEFEVGTTFNITLKNLKP